MATLGRELREERERRAVSLKEISDRTKISARLLQDLENDRWEELPPQLFLRGLIKSYCQSIGADPGIHLASYDEQRGVRREAPEKGNDEIEGWKIEAPVFRFRRRISRFAVVLPVVVLAAAAPAAWLWLLPGKGTPPRITRPEVFKSVPRIVPPAASEIQERKPPSLETGLRLEFRFRADSWMHITADGRVVLDGIRPAGSTANLRTEREFILQTGNAGGFDLAINGRPAHPLGGAGVVLTDIRINAANIETYIKENKRPEPGSAGL
jgi:cytoskeleton protein RodZ